VRLLPAAVAGGASCLAGLIDTGAVGETALVPRSVMTVEQILSVLRETPNRLATLTGAAAPAQLRAVPEPGEWSVTEVLAHLRSCADMWGNAIETIVASEHPTLKAVNPTTWIESTDYRELEFGPSLKAFIRQRARLLTLLETLAPGGWSRSATVVGGGRPIERSVHNYANRLARHERAHWRQLEKTVNSVAVG
jgi:hypothetical protein